jgi:SAM-dependent methyltransferase
MPIGPPIRRMFGPFEHGVAELYRRIFIDLDDFAELMHTWIPQAHRILEVGCGEGAMTERLVTIYPTAAITAIDITPRTGRLFRGNSSTVTFREEVVESVAAREPASFDLVVLCDVMHHVPREARDSLLSAVNRSLALQGKLVIKDWAISPWPIHWLCEMSDRYLTGDNVSYFTMSSIKTMLTGSFGVGCIQQFGTVRPWRNNIALLVERSRVPNSLGGSNSLTVFGLS